MASSRMDANMASLSSRSFCRAAALGGTCTAGAEPAMLDDVRDDDALDAVSRTRRPLAPNLWQSVNRTAFRVSSPSRKLEEAPKLIGNRKDEPSPNATPS